MPPAPTWNNEYPAIMEFFFWESQHLGKRKNPDSKFRKLQEVLDHLRTMEVTLHHHCNGNSCATNPATHSCGSSLTGS